MSLRVPLQLFAAILLIAIVVSDDNSATWTIVDDTKHLCTENTKIIVKKFSAFDCSLTVPDTKFSFTAVAVQIDTIPGDTFLNKDVTGYGIIFNDYHIQVSGKNRLGGSENDLKYEKVNEYVTDTNSSVQDSLVKRLLPFLGQNSDRADVECKESKRKIEFRDDGTYSLTWIPEESKRFKIGFGYNSVWLGCPQPICLDGSVDAVMVQDDNMFVFRGAYVWEITQDSPEQEDAWAITQVKTSTAESKPVYFDSGYYNAAFILISFGVFYSSDNAHGPYRNPVKMDNLDDVLAAFIHGSKLILISKSANSSTNCMHTINDANFTLTNSPQRAPQCQKISNEELSKANINAMFVLDDELHVMKGWKYASLGSVDAFLKSSGQGKIEKWEYSFLEVLGCDTHSYTVWGPTYGFNYYRDYIDIHFDRPRSNIASVYFIALIDLIVLIVIEVITVIFAFIYWNKYRKESEMGLLSMMNAYQKGGRQGVGARFKRAKMEKDKFQESKGSKLDVRRSKMSQLDVLDLPESMIGGSKKKGKDSGSKIGSKLDSKVGSKIGSKLEGKTSSKIAPKASKKGPK